MSTPAELTVVVFVWVVHVCDHLQMEVRAKGSRFPANNPIPCARLTDGTDAPVNNNINEWGIRNEYRKDRRNRRRFGRNRRRVRRDSTDGHDPSRRRSHRWNLRDRGSPRARHGDGIGAYRPGPHLRRGSCGRHVHRGDTIGFVGLSGRSTGPHLHYEVRINDTPVNPHKYLRLTFAHAGGFSAGS